MRRADGPCRWDHGIERGGGRSLGHCIRIYGACGCDVLSVVLPSLSCSLVLCEIPVLMCGEFEMQVTVTLMQRRWDFQ